MKFQHSGVVILLVALSASLSWGQSQSRDRKDGRLETTTYYVNYWCEEWKKSDRCNKEQATKREKALKRLGVETKVVDVTLPTDVDPFPKQGVDYRVYRVQFRLTDVKSISIKDEDDPIKLAASWKEFGIDIELTTKTPLDQKVRSLVFPLQAYGMDVQVTSQAPLKEIPKEAQNVQLPKESVWTGTIFQREQELPARLELKNAGGLLVGELSFTFQPRNLQNRPLPKQSYKVEVKGEVKDGTVTLTATKSLGKGKVFIPTTYTLKLSDAKSMKGQWEAQSEKDNMSLKLSEATPKK